MNEGAQFIVGVMFVLLGAGGLIVTRIVSNSQTQANADRVINAMRRVPPGWIPSRAAHEALGRALLATMIALGGVFIIVGVV